jgi:dTDP-4-amino-4,6-dideoxygalactose transaminase
MIQKKIFLGDWYTTVIAPKDTWVKNTGYQSGMCPQAEAVAKEVINFPTHYKITRAQIEKIAYDFPINTANTQ